MTQIGSVDSLMFDLNWAEPEARGSAADATNGTLAAFVNGEPVWGRRILAGSIEPFPWTWIELFEFLAQAWNYLEWEETDPLGLQVEDPSLLRAAAERRWLDMPRFRRDSEEHALWGFEDTHDLSHGIQGAWLPSLWLLRQGNLMLVRSRGTRATLNTHDALKTLEALGNEISRRLHGLPDARARAAIDSWAQRRAQPAEEMVLIATGLSNETARAVEKGREPQDFWELPDDHFEVTELLAAARLVGHGIAAKHIRTIISRLRLFRHKATPALDALSHEATQVLAADFFETAYEEGYALAAWLRAKMNLDARVDPDVILQTWGVSVRDIELPDVGMDAVACWGPRHGPAILVNRKGTHAHSKAGRRASLAHEIAHLLIDRASALPVAEVLGGLSPPWPEARARAFAAEILLPRAIAAAEMASSSAPEETLSKLCRVHGVSKEIVAWQARNSNVPLPSNVYNLLKSHVLDTLNF